MKSISTFPTEISVSFDTNNTSVAAASYNQMTGIIETKRFSTGEDLSSQISRWRESIGQPFSVSDTAVLLAEPHFTAHTRIASIPDEILHREDDDEITKWLVEASRESKMGEDGLPIFEANLVDASYDFTRLPNGEIALTELPRPILQLGIGQAAAADLFGKRASGLQVDDNLEIPAFSHYFETRIRAIARYLLDREETDDKKTVLFLAFTRDGASLALWDRNRTFFYELGEYFRFDTEDEDVADEIGLTGEEVYLSEVENFLYSQVYHLLFPENGERVELSRIYAVADELTVDVLQIVERFADEMESPLTPADAAFNEAVAAGLLLAADEDAARKVLAVNLAFDLTRQIEVIETELEKTEKIKRRRKRISLIAALLLPIIAVAAIIAGIRLNTLRVSGNLVSRYDTAKASKKRLEPVLAERALYERTLVWFQDIITQIIKLRTKQIAAISFPASLDQFYPADNSFFVSEMNLEPDGAFSLKGYTSNKDAVTQFVRSFEFADASARLDLTDQSAASGNRLFENIRLEFRQGIREKWNGSAGGGASSLGSLPAGVFGFEINGTFALMNVVSSPEIPAGQIPPNLPNSQSPSAYSSPSTGQPQIITSDGGEK